MTHIDTTDKQTPSQESTANLLAWALFSKYLFACIGLGLSFAGVVCFFAFNWDEIHYFTKFGLIISLIIACLAVAMRGSMESFYNKLYLAACLLIGPLMAVFGQTYQTGADAWELFASWALVTLPIAILGNQGVLWLMTWVLSNTCLFLLYEQVPTTQDYLLWGQPLAVYQVAINLIGLMIWESAAAKIQTSALTFLQHRWFPRIMVASLCYYATIKLSLTIEGQPTFDIDTSGADLLLDAMSIAFLVGGMCWYSLRCRDIICLALLTCGIYAISMYLVIENTPSSDTVTFLTTLGFAVLGLSVPCLIFLRTMHRKFQSLAQASKTTGQEQPLLKAPLSALLFLAAFFKSVNVTLPLFPRPQHTSGPSNAEVLLAEQPETTTEQQGSWIIHLFAFISAWIASALLLVAFAFAVGETMFLYYLLAIGLGVCGVFMSKQEGIFIEHLSQAFMILSALTLSIIIPLDMNLHTFQLVPSLFIALTFCAVSQNRFTTTLSGIYALAIAACTLYELVYMLPLGWELAFEQTKSSLSSSFLSAPILLWTLAGSLLCLAMGWLLAMAWSRTNVPNTIAKLFPSLSLPLALLGALLLFGIVHTAKTVWLRPQNFGFFYVMIGSGLGASLALTILIRQYPGKLLATPPPGWYYAILFICLAIPSFYHPFIGVGLLSLFCARLLASPALYGLGTLYLCLSVIYTYYDLNITLLAKSKTLLLAGALALLLSYYLHRLIKYQQQRGCLPANTLLTENLAVQAPLFSRAMFHFKPKTSAPRSAPYA